jgi:hypothetical protein
VNSSGAGDSAVEANYVQGGTSGESIDGSRFVNGGSAGAVFMNPTTSDFWPTLGSPLVGSAAPQYAWVVDFNNTARLTPFDVGAYETNGLTANPGWKLTTGFKKAPLVNTLPAAPTNLRIE